MTNFSTLYPPTGASGLFANLNPPHYITNAYYRPIGYGVMGGATGTNMTATRVYYFPLAIWENHTFSGASVYNSGTSDNGKKYRLMVFNEASGGGPGTLAKDFGEITLTGAAALRTLSSSWAATAGMYWGAVWAEQDSAMYAMLPWNYLSAVGTLSGPQIDNFTGSLSTGLINGNSTMATTMYVDTTYGAAPASAVAPTSSLLYPPSATGSFLAGPCFWLKG